MVCALLKSCLMYVGALVLVVILFGSLVLLSGAIYAVLGDVFLYALIMAVVIGCALGVIQYGLDL